MKNKKKYCLILSVATTACLGMGTMLCATGCKPKEPTPVEVSLTGFDVPEILNYEYGSSIDVTPPIVVDNYGNVVDVSCTVKDSAGNPVTVSYGRFFAEDDAYTFEYQAKTLDGKTHNKLVQINIVESFFDLGTQLVDVETSTKYNFTQSFSTEEKEEFSKWSELGVTYKIYSSTTRETTTLSEPIMDFSRMEEGCYTFTAELPMGNPAKQEIIYSGSFDFYRSTESMVWFTEKLSTANVICKDDVSAEKMQVEIVSSGLPAGALAEDYYKISIPASQPGTSIYLFSFVGTHSKEYYQMWNELASVNGLSYALEFDFCHNAEKKAVEEGIEYDGFTEFHINGERSAYTEDVWYTVSIPMSDILHNYDAYCDIANTDYVIEEESGSYYANMIWSDNVSYYGLDMTAYFGNFRVVCEAESAEQEGILLVDKRGKTSFTCNDLLDDKLKARFEECKKQGEIVWTLNEVEDDNLFDKEGVCEARAIWRLNGEEILLYKATVDMYNSADGLVWRTAFSTEDVLHKDFISDKKLQVELATDGLPDGAGANLYYKISIDGSEAGSSLYLFSLAGQHSKEYYSYWLEDGLQKNVQYCLQFEFWHNSEIVAVYEGVEYDGYGEFHINGVRQVYNEQQWYTVSIPLADIVANWDVYHNPDDTNYVAGEGITEYNLIWSDNVNYYGLDMTGYFGNFVITKQTLFSEEDDFESNMQEDFFGESKQI